MMHSLSRTAATGPAPGPGPASRAASGPSRGLAQVLVVEDEADVAALLRLQLAELPVEVRVACDGEHGLALALSGDFDLIVLDLRLPRLGGLELCRELRAAGRTVPVMMLTARAGELDRVHGLDVGADDYLTKPFSALELRARVKALLRRAAMSASSASAPSGASAGPSATPASLRFGALQLDRTRHKATLSGADIALAPREWDLLWFFAEHPGQAFSRAELLDRVWGYGHDGYDHTVNSHINRLRAKLGEGRSQPAFIHTVWGLGYRFESACVT